MAKVLGIINGVFYLICGVVLILVGMFGGMTDMLGLFYGLGAGVMVAACVNIFFAVKSDTVLGAFGLLVMGICGMSLLNIIAGIVSVRSVTAEDRMYRKEERRERKQEYRDSFSEDEKKQNRKFKALAVLYHLVFILLTSMHNLVVLMIINDIFLPSEVVLLVLLVVYVISAAILWALKGGAPFFRDDYTELTFTDSGIKQKEKTSYIPNLMLILYIVIGTISLFTHLIGLIVVLCYKPGKSTYPCNNIYKKIPATYKNGWLVSSICSLFFGFVFVEKEYY